MNETMTHKTVANYFCPHCKHKIKAVTSDDGDCPYADLHYTRIQRGDFTGDSTSYVNFLREKGVEVGMGIRCKGFIQLEHDHNLMSRYRLLRVKE